METQAWQVKAGKYMTVVVSIDLLNIKVVVYKKLSCKLTNLPFYQDCQIPVVATIGLLHAHLCRGGVVCWGHS